tara:strand:+ start:1084 stop:1200 length:117 start_codon:yes stop_codon:yes gene_type:complete
MIKVKINGNIVKNKFCKKFIVINFEDDSKKIIKRNANK